MFLRFSQQWVKIWRMFVNLLKKKSVIWALCSVPMGVIVAKAFYVTEFWKQTIAISGYTAAVLLAICLVLAPLQKKFPRVQLFNFLNRRKRQIGLSVFFYALFHAFAYFMERYYSQGAFPWIYLLHPVNIPGVIALIILLVMALMSNDFSIKRLGYARWKYWQKTVYLVEGCVFLHMAFQFGSIFLWGCLIFIPLLFIQRLRLLERL